MKLFKVNILLGFLILCLPFMARAQSIEKLIGSVSFDQIENKQKVSYNLKLFQISKPNENNFKLKITADNHEKKTENIIEVEKENHFVQFYKNWSGKDLTDDGKAEIIFDVANGGTCNVCSGLSVYTIYQSQLQKIEINHKINGSEFSLIDIQEEDNIPLIIGRNYFYIDGFFKIEELSLDFVLKWSKEEKFFKKPLNTNLSKRKIYSQIKAANDDLSENKNSSNASSILSYYLAFTKLALLSKHFLTKSEDKKSVKNFTRLNEDTLKYAYKQCLDALDFNNKCDELNTSIKNFLSSQDLL